MLRKVTHWQHKSMLAYMNGLERILAPMYGNLLAAGLRMNGRKLRSGRYYVSVIHGAYRGIAGLFNDGNAMVQARDEEALEDFIYLMDDANIHTVWGLGTDLTPWVEPMKEFFSMVRCQELVMMEQVKQVSAETLPIRFVDAQNSKDQDRIYDFILRCMSSCFGFQTTRETMIARMSERTPEESYVLAEVDGQYVAQAHVQAWTPHYAYIGGVATLPGFRCYGYGGATLTKLCSYAFSGGRTPTLSVAVTNEQAVRLYQKLGFEEREKIIMIERRE